MLDRRNMGPKLLKTEIENQTAKKELETSTERVREHRALKVKMNFGKNRIAKSIQ